MPLPVNLLPGECVRCYGSCSRTKRLWPAWGVVEMIVAEYREKGASLPVDTPKSCRHGARADEFSPNCGKPRIPAPGGRPSARRYRDGGGQFRAYRGSLWSRA